MEGPHNHNRKFLRLLRENPDITLEELVAAGYGDVPIDSIAKKDYLVTIKEGEEWLRENPYAKTSNTPVVYYRVLSETYGGLKNAKKELGIMDAILQKKKMVFDEWLKENPRYGYKELSKEHKYVLRTCYQNKLNVARKELGLKESRPRLSDVPKLRENVYKTQRQELEMFHNDFVNWLRNKPNASRKEALSKYRPVIETFYESSFKKARTELGIKRKGKGLVNEKSYAIKSRHNKQYSDEELDILKTEFDGYMKSHTSATSKDVRGKYNVILVNYYENSLVKAREMLGLPKYSSSDWGRQKIKEDELQNRKIEFDEWLKNNPNVSRIYVPGRYRGVIEDVYKKTLNEIRAELGIQKIENRPRKYSPEEIEIQKKEFHEALIKNPEMKIYEAARDYKQVFTQVYRNHINDAKKAAGVDFKQKRSELREQKRRELIDWLKHNPNATYLDSINAGFKKILNSCYRGHISDAREDAGFGKKRYRGAEIPELSGVEFNINRQGIEKLNLWEFMEGEQKNSSEARVLRMFKMKPRKMEEVPRFLRVSMVYAIRNGYIQRIDSPAIFAVYIQSKKNLENLTIPELQSKLNKEYHSSEIEGALESIGYSIISSKQGQIITRRG